ncbi:MAG: hypothetical protein KDI46_07995 [Alphaproteobacteria bacterium]|nr:hypothetical protein [Alphaproteobacteria bacterium]
MGVGAHHFALRVGLQAHLCLGLFSFALMMSWPALASEPIKSLNEDNVTDFITETTHITQGAGARMQPHNVEPYLEKHLSDNAHFASTITYHIPDMEPQNMSLDLGKSDFIKSVKEGVEGVLGYENHVEVKDIKINFWATQAVVKTHTLETGFMSIPTPDGGMSQDMPMKGDSECAQVLVLKKGVIQVQSAVCKTSVTFSK